MNPLIFTCLVYSAPHGWVDVCYPYKIRCTKERVIYKDFEKEVELIVEPSSDIYEKMKEINSLNKTSYELTVEPICEYWLPPERDVK